MKADVAIAFEQKSGSTRTWLRCRIHDLCTEDRRIVEPGSPLAATLPYLSLEDVESITGRVLIEPNGERNNAGQSTSFQFDQRHVLYGKLRPYLNKVALPQFAGRCTTELIPLLPRPETSRELVALLLRRPQTVEAAMRCVTGARMPRADMEAVLGQEVLVPPTKEEQEHLASAILARLDLIQRARTLCAEQIALLDSLHRRTVEELGNGSAAMNANIGPSYGY